MPLVLHKSRKHNLLTLKKILVLLLNQYAVFISLEFLKSVLRLFWQIYAKLNLLAKSHACFSFIMSINLSRCYSEGLPRCCPSTFCHWQQNSEDPQVQGSGPWPARGSVPPHQEGCGGQEAPGEKQKGTAKLGQWPGTRSYSITWKISLFSM